MIHQIMVIFRYFIKNYLIIIILNYYILFFICRAIDFQALVGNIGGYIGLLLGYSLLQIPEFITWVMFKFKRYFNRSSNIDEQTKGNAIKPATSYRKNYEGKITYVDQPNNNPNDLNRRETEILERIKSLEQWRAEMMKA